ncbi:BQ5605_C015g07729 [Microbotryum silenes-dioicae]|uniref:ATP-dependent DNA helicase n=1 Tax=Microbotryum silenes-dioicae TaxID=796604 RepID=A0A2X0LWX1_9BASI|nr:BQ5605_C015g07729 [Microbotryum silenes-dioicae]
MTCNPAWPEIVNALLPGQTASNCPDIVAQVFQGKLTACLHDMETMADPASSAGEDGGYPHYCRRNLHRFIKFPGTEREEIYTDASVVSTNPWLASKYNCHINVEIANGVAAVKCLYKYVYKGHDRTLFTVEAGAPRNKVKGFLDARYVCAPEAMHRLFQYQMHGHKPAVTCLALHLPNEQQVQFDPEDGPPTAAAPPEMTLTAFVKLCATVPPVPKAQNLLYLDVPRSFRWDLNKQAWQERKTNTPTIGRMYFCGPEAGERYYLRLLLLNVPSPTSFAQLRTFAGTEFKTFQEACVERGLLQDNTEANRCLTEAAVLHSGHQLCHLFAMLLTADGGVSNAAESWETHYNSLSDDAKYHLRMRRTSLCDHGLPLPTATFENELKLSQLMMEERSTPEQIEQMNEAWMKNLEAFTVEQRHTFERICDSVFNAQGKMFFINAPGGTGKTFLETRILSQIRSENKYALAVASSGIAALLLPKGRTAHSRFKIPIDIFDD